MSIYPNKVDEREDVRFVRLTGYIVAGCCHYLSATLHLTPGGLCLRVFARACISMCLCARACMLFGQNPSGCCVFFFLFWGLNCFSKMTCFRLKTSPSGWRRERCSFPTQLLLHVCLRVCACARCMTCSLRLRRASFCTDITSSLQSHTVFHSINFCPPPWAHFTGVNSSPPLGWVCGCAVRATVGTYWLNLNRKWRGSSSYAQLTSR